MLLLATNGNSGRILALNYNQNINIALINVCFNTTSQEASRHCVSAINSKDLEPQGLTTLPPPQ